MKALNERLSSTRRSPRGRWRSGSSSCSPLPGSCSSSPQRSKVGELEQSVEAAQTELVTRQHGARASVGRCQGPGERHYRLTKALPDGVGMAGVILDVNRVARQPQAHVHLDHAVPRPSPGTGFSAQPLTLVLAGPLQQRLGLPRRHPRARPRRKSTPRCPRTAVLGRLASISRRPTTRSSRRQGDGHPSTPSPSAARPRLPTQARPRPRLRPPAGRSQQERPPDGQDPEDRSRRPPRRASRRSSSSSAESPGRARRDPGPQAAEAAASSSRPQRRRSTRRQAPPTPATGTRRLRLATAPVRLRRRRRRPRPSPTQGKLISFSLFASRTRSCQQVGDKPACARRGTSAEDPPVTGSATPPRRDLERAGNGRHAGRRRDRIGGAAPAARGASADRRHARDQRHGRVPAGERHVPGERPRVRARHDQAQDRRRSALPAARSPTGSCSC